MRHFWSVFVRIGQDLILLEKSLKKIGRDRPDFGRDWSNKVGIGRDLQFPAALGEAFEKRL